MIVVYTCTGPGHPDISQQQNPLYTEQSQIHVDYSFVPLTWKRTGEDIILNLFHPMSPARILQM